MSDKYAALRQEISNCAIGSRDHLRKIALQLLDEIAEREAEREADKARIAQLERDETQLIMERDSAETALGEMYEAVMGELPQWSNCYGYDDAIDDVANRAAGITLETGE